MWVPGIIPHPHTGGITLCKPQIQSRVLGPPMPHQVPLTVIANIKPGHEDSLDQTLAGMRANVAQNDIIPFGKLPGLHFARLLILAETRDLDGQPIPAQLVFLADFDAPLDDRLRELTTIAPRGLHEIFRHCEGYPDEPSVATSAQAAYLQNRMANPAANYVNTVGLGLQQIRQEAQLRDAIEGFLDGHDWSRSRPEETRAAIQEFVRKEPALGWALRPAEPPDLLFRFKEVLHFVAVPLGLLVVSPATLLALPLWTVLLRIHERTDPAPLVRPDDARIQKLAALEDHIVQNQFSAAGFVKPSWFRRTTASIVLYLVYWGIRHLYNRADLAGVKTIHFARWIFIDDKRRLIFASNYDGSLESYMDDFIDKVAWGLNAVFSNGADYPKTNWLVRDGASDELAFKYFIRTHQMPTQVWYSAYPDLTAINIENNAQIRAGLFTPMDARQTEAWLRRF